MINQEELSGVIEKNVPELSGICDRARSRNVYDVVRHMLSFTTSQLATHNLKAAKKCFALADLLYRTGNQAIRNAIENVYVFSFSHAFFHDEKKRKEILEIIPGSLYELYRKQLISSHL